MPGMHRGTGAPEREGSQHLLPLVQVVGCGGESQLSLHTSLFKWPGAEGSRQEASHTPLPSNCAIRDSAGSA